MPSRSCLTLLAAVFLATVHQPQAASAQATEEWCSARDVGRSQHCEIRQHRFTLRGSDLVIDVGPNGNIEVESYDGSEVRVTARVTARGRNEAAARDLAGRVQLRTAGGEVRATGPRTSGSESWGVSVRVSIPARVAVNARTTNGNIVVSGTAAPVELRSTNGNITVTDAASRLDIRTTNGSIRAALGTHSMPLEGVQVRSTNGSVQLTLPQQTSARLELSTTNGGITTDIPISVQGRVSRRQLSAVLGNGGPEIRISTTNGSIRISGS
jgi:DUF4097 and DUF4098 domain-containing protein YvlB